MLKKILKVDLNDWALISKDDVIPSKNNRYLVIKPQKTEDGKQLDSIYFKHKKVIDTGVENCDGVEWNKDILISTSGDEVEYAKRVEWWFNNAINNDEYKSIMNSTFANNGFDVKMSWEKSKTWLKTQTPSKRKTDINRFIWNWLHKGYNWQINRLEKQRKYGK